MTGLPSSLSLEAQRCAVLALWNITRSGAVIAASTYNRRCIGSEEMNGTKGDDGDLAEAPRGGKFNGTKATTNLFDRSAISAACLTPFLAHFTVISVRKIHIWSLCYGIQSTFPM
jgi:hypothetical protein